MSPQAENVLAAAVGAGAVWLVFQGAARSAVARQIVAGISQLDETVGRDREQAILSMPREAQAAIDREVDAALRSHLGITALQLRTLVADIRKIQRLLP
jgi:NADH/NAD ratio-sensing transcriptional regulator Rex